MILGNMQNEQIIKKIEGEEENLQEEQEKISLLETFQKYEGKDEIITSKEALVNLEEERKNPPTKFMAGIPTLDSLLDGFREGDLIIISAPTKMGKTTLAQTLTHNLSQKDIPCLWFSWEMRQREFLEKFGEPIPYFVLPKSLTNSSIDWVETRIIESIAKYGTKIVFLDHLHYIVDLQTISQKAGISLLIGGIVRELKRMALKWNICIFLIAHTTKLKYVDEPELSDIRDSSFISQEADTVLMMWRLKKEGNYEFTNEARLAVRANRRNGRTGSMNLILKDNKFYEKDNYQSAYSELS